ncbi:hypothetical protein [Burkholderia sp. PAMC 26561]|uniref:hypothetical protein n=1 Tax=Burkholderia sp. PAMC 26561 TaxID=1795043 RepID=UPI0013C4CE77|nr:hypothetical protein [Burkholderia sp. PAMC 26561]
MSGHSTTASKSATMEAKTLATVHPPIYRAMNSEFKQAEAWQRELLNRLMMEEFEGCEAVRLQLKDCLVSVDTLDSDGSFALHVLNRVPAVVSSRVPAGLAGYVGCSDYPIAVLLHVLNEICHEVEIYHSAGDKIMELPQQWVSLGTVMRNFP